MLSILFLLNAMVSGIATTVFGLMAGFSFKDGETVTGIICSASATACFVMFVFNTIQLFGG